MNEWIPVYQATNSLEAHTLKGSLEVSGVTVQLQGEALSGALGELPANAVEVTLLVRAQDLEQARKILESYRRGAGLAWYCRHCGEHNAGSFETCWQCGHESDITEL